MKRNVRRVQKSASRRKTKKGVKTKVEGYIISKEALKLIDQSFSKMQDALVLAKKAYQLRFKGVK